MPVLQKKALFSAFIICQVLRIIQNYMEVSPAKSLILSATIHGGSYFFIQPTFGTALPLLFYSVKNGLDEPISQISWYSACQGSAKNICGIMHIQIQSWYSYQTGKNQNRFPQLLFSHSFSICIILPYFFLYAYSNLNVFIYKQD